MGAYSPAPVLTPQLEKECMERLIAPALKAMADAGTPYTGVLFAGVMITKDGPKLLEFNVRYGDPETQVLMARIKNDLLPVLLAAAQGRLSEVHLEWSSQRALVVVMAANGYPEAYEKNTRIDNLDQAAQIKGVTVLHAGTATGPKGEILSVGGRVLGITAVGDTVKQAQDRAYHAIDLIHWPQGFCRHDIGWRAIARERG
jgi:phosphoribosylamine--glycine ligase